MTVVTDAPDPRCEAAEDVGLLLTPRKSRMTAAVSSALASSRKAFGISDAISRISGRVPLM